MKTKMFIFVLALVMFLGGCDKNDAMKISYPDDFKTLVLKYSSENNIDPYLVFGIIKRESKFMHKAESSKGARGLMQLTKATAEWIAEFSGMESFYYKDIFEPSVNIRLGCAYFAHLLDVYSGNIPLALCAYNAGLGNVNSWLSDGTLSKDNFDAEKIPFEETRKYVKDVMEYAKVYKQLYPEIAE